MELNHFGHDHPLILNEGHKDDGEEVSCYGCVQPISGPSYGCIQCQYFLHKSCAELPREMTHPSHPEHPLTLLPNPPARGYWGRCVCDICRESVNRFIYHCSHCKFDVDINCASMVQGVQRRIEHRCPNEHPLIPLETPAMFLCHACYTKHEGTSYLCITCGFWVNQKCASLPSTVNLSHHHHPLTLVYSIPFEYFRFRPKCQFCDNRLYRRSWLYYCSECSYFVHVKCATSEMTEECKPETEQQDVVTSGIATSKTEQSKAEIKAKDLDPNPITLPVPDESVDTITQFIEYIRLQGKYTEEATEIMHFSHDHPLILSKKKIEDESCSGSKLPLSNEVLKNDDDEKCNGCAQTISKAAPFYHCAEDQCSKFYLHQWCAELPTELRQHPCHLEHPLSLITQQQPSSTNFHLHRCEICRLSCNVFVFGCSACDFYLDSNCAFLPRIIRHEAHKHTLALRQSGPDSCCSACNTYICRFAFVCDLCKLNVCSRCAFLPGSVRHRYDEHPFTLTYSPLKDQPDEYYCEICDEEIDSEFWFYHCVKCDQSLHTECIRPPVDENSNIKYGVTFTVGRRYLVRRKGRIFQS